MTALIVVADDIAITNATTLGVLDAISHGIVRNTGIFTNTPHAPFAAERLKELKGVDVGIDLNFVTGRPILPAAQVPKIVDGKGRFRSSGHIRSEFPVRRREGYYNEFETEPFDYKQTLAEARAQVMRFFELMGRPPVYIHHHSLVSLMTDQVLHEVADEFDLLIIDDLFRFNTVPLLANRWYSSPFPLEEQAKADPVGALEQLLPEILANEISVLITHPGYVDAELLDASTFSIIRSRDQQMLTSPHVTRLLDEAGIQITTFSEAGVRQRSTTGHSAFPGPPPVQVP